MNGIQIGYARVSAADQDLTSQRDALLRVGVLDSNIYVDHGLPAPTAPGRGFAKRSPLSGRVTRLSSLSSTDSPAR